LRLAPDHPVAMHAQITLRPRHGMKMIPELRNGMYYGDKKFS
jgi:hypothetical protein